MKINFTLPIKGRISYSYENFSQAKFFLFEKWCELAEMNSLSKPIDLSQSCKYGSLFIQQVFGGSIRGHYEHQYNLINGRLIDLSHDSLDVGKMNNPYLHEQEYFEIPELHASLTHCLPRAKKWADEFIERKNL